MNGVTGSGVGRVALRTARTGVVARAERNRPAAALQQRGRPDRVGEALLRGSPTSSAAKSVVIVQDAFTSYYDTGGRPGLLRAAAAARLRAVAGAVPAQRQAAARARLAAASSSARPRANAEMLNALAATGVALVGVDPSMTLAYRAEYVKALGKERAPTWRCRRNGWPAHRPAAALAARASEHLASAAALHREDECTRSHRRLGQRSLADSASTCACVPAGCCGMAGLYGHERANRHDLRSDLRSSAGSRLVSDPRHTRSSRRHRLFVPLPGIVDRRSEPAPSPPGPARARQGR